MSKKEKKSWQKFKSSLKFITIEPAMILSYLSNNITQVTQSQMVLYKTCMDPKFNLSSEFCDNYEDNTNTTQYVEVEEELASFYNIKTIVMHAVPIVLCFYIGSLSDNYGRKPFALMVLLARLVAAVMGILNAIYLTEMNRWVWLGTVAFTRALYGGEYVYSLITCALIADNSESRSRTIRLAMVDYTNQLINPISGLIGAWLFTTGGYVLVFSVGLVFDVLALIAGFARLWNLEEKLESNVKISFLEIIHPKHVVDTIKVAFRKREGKKRAYLLITLLQQLINLFPWELAVTVQFLYVKRLFRWGVEEYSWYNFLWNIGGLIGSTVVFPVFHWLNWSDNANIIFSSASMILSGLLRGLAKEGWLFNLAAVLDVGNATGFTPIRSQLTKCVEPGEVGKVNALLSMTGTLVPIFIDIGFTKLYVATKELPYPGAGTSYFVVCGSLSVAIIAALLMSWDLGWGQISQEEEGQNKKRHPSDGKSNDSMVCHNLESSTSQL